MNERCERRCAFLIRPDRISFSSQSRFACLLHDQRQERSFGHELKCSDVARCHLIEIAVLRARHTALIGAEHACAMVDRRTATKHSLRQATPVIKIERCETCVLSDDVAGRLAGDDAAARIVNQVVALRCEPARTVGTGHVSGVVGEDRVLQREVGGIAT